MIARCGARQISRLKKVGCSHSRAVLTVGTVSLLSELPLAFIPCRFVDVEKHRLRTLLRLSRNKEAPTRLSQQRAAARQTMSNPGKKVSNSQTLPAPQSSFRCRCFEEQKMSVESRRQKVSFAQVNRTDDNRRTDGRGGHKK